MAELSRRLWDKDLTLWQATSADPEVGDRLGWLDVFDWLPDATTELGNWAKEVAGEGRFRSVVVLGMGGSSLAPLLFSRLFPAAPEYPSLHVLDSTAPDMVQAVVDLGVAETLFIVASKSGTTLETMDLYRFFFGEAMKHNDSPGNQFVAITDPGSWLEGHAADAGFSRVFLNPADIGGRYSALSYFGLVPAALMGVDVASVVSRAADFAETTKGDTTSHAEALGKYLGESANAGRNKLLLQLPDRLRSLGSWIEQLVAESTGKNGLGILPVVLDQERIPLDTGDAITIRIDERVEPDLAGWSLSDPLDVGIEFFRWEFATAIAGAVIGVNPFDQPNVAEAKTSTTRFISGEGALPSMALHETASYEVLSSADLSTTTLPFTRSEGSYLALLTYLPMSPAIESALDVIRAAIGNRYRMQATLGFGPRYLHSTGQLHKGGPPNGNFLIFSDDSRAIAQDNHSNIPGREYGFAELINAQADGDTAVLVDRGLPVMRVLLKGDRLKSIQAFAADFGV